MFIIVAVFSYGLLKVIRLFTFEEPDFIRNEVLKDMYLDYDEPFNAIDNRFEYAFAFLSILPYKYVAHDERIGHIAMRSVELDQTGDQFIFIKTVTEFGFCDPDKDFI